MTERNPAGQSLLMVWTIIGCLLLLLNHQTTVAHENPVFKPTVRIGETLYVSAKGSRNPETGEHPADMGTATTQTMLNIDQELSRVGFTFSDVVSVQVWLTDLEKYQEMNNAYRQFFGQQFPARTTLGVTALPDGSMVQIAMVAVKGPKQVIRPTGADTSNLPFSPGILAGDTLYLSGHVGINPESGKLVEGDIGDHVVQTLKNIQAVLKAADMDLSHVISAYLYMKNVEDFAAVSNAYLTMITEEPRPARLPMSVAKLPLDSPVEITMIASRKPRQAIIGEGQPPSGSYSRGLLSNNVMHLAGVFRREGTIQRQVNEGIEWLTAILKAGNMQLKNVVEVHVYLADIGDYAALTAACRQKFSDGGPTLAVTAVPQLPARSSIMLGLVAARELVSD
ncbi:MAG: Rid family hydrolase [Fuerstiella sp.]|nr:Rid family hydrolase [Fuerstiella sp.]